MSPKQNRRESVEVISGTAGRQYHIGLGADDIADNIIAVGDPARAERAAQLFDTVHCERGNREYRTFTGTYRGLPLSVISTGIGCDNTEIAVVEICQLRHPVTIIRCGSCGALQPDIAIGDLVISSGAVRLENTSTHFVEEGYPAIASHELVLALLKAAAALALPHHLGLTATASGFYGAQGRQVEGFPVRDEGLLDRLARQGVKNFEMESSTLFTLASLRGFRAATVCAVFASRPANRFIQARAKTAAELAAIRTALHAFEIVEAMDRQKGAAPFWLPDLKMAGMKD
jgi:uridine phosphorylase